jgi:SAM-dependent methyltransferase
MAGPDIAFWQTLYRNGTTPWDDGADDPELLAWLDAGTLRAADGPVVVPGCGSGRDLAVLAARGFAVTGLDYAPVAVGMARERLARAGLQAAVEEADVLAWAPPEPVAAVLERTCLCALHPDHWIRYAQQLHAWLRPGGRLFAQFEQVKRPGAAEGRIEGPPYHCDINAMRALFPAERWSWPKPPHRRGSGGPADGHLGVVLTALPSPSRGEAT